MKSPRNNVRGRRPREKCWKMSLFPEQLDRKQRVKETQEGSDMFGDPGEGGVRETKDVSTKRQTKGSTVKWHNK